MPLKRHIFAALLAILLLLSAWALAEIDLKPYEIESDRFTPVEILAPDVYLVLQGGSLNGATPPTALVLLDHGQKAFEQRLPKEPSDDPRTVYSLFVADENRYGLRILDTYTRFTRFRLLENGALTEGFSIEGYPCFEPLPDWLCRLHQQDGMCFVDRFDWDGVLLSSTPVSEIEPTSYSGFTVLSDKSIAYIAWDIYVPQNRYTLHHLRVSRDGEPLSAVSVSLPNESFTPTGAFSPNGGILSFTDAKLTGLREPYFSFLACSDTDGNLRFAKSLKAKDNNCSVTQAVLRDDGSSTVYGTVIRSSRSVFRAFRLELDASGHIVSRDVRDFTTRADYLYTVKLDPLGNAYVVTEDENRIAIVPFEDLPVLDDIEFVPE